MATVTLKGNAFNTSGNLPATGETAKEFSLVKNDLSEVNLASFGNKTKILNISADLPFAQKRFCGAEGIDNVETYSCF